MSRENVCKQDAEMEQERQAIEREGAQLTKKRKRLQNQMAELEQKERQLQRRAQLLAAKMDKREEWEKEVELNQVQKQYDAWCRKVCDAFGKPWDPVRKTILSFHALHYDWGYTHVLSRLLTVLVRDLTDIIAGYAEEQEPLALISDSTYEAGSWLEAQQAMFWLWLPHAEAQTRVRIMSEFVEITMGMGYQQQSVSYGVDWSCRDESCDCEIEEERRTVKFTWDKEDKYQGEDDFRKSLDELFQHFQSQDSTCDCSWLDLMQAADKLFNQPEMVPALFLAYFAEEIQWQDEC